MIFVLWNLYSWACEKFSLNTPAYWGNLEAGSWLIGEKVLLSLKQKYFSSVEITQESEGIGIGALLSGQEQVDVFPDTLEVEK